MFFDWILDVLDKFSVSSNYLLPVQLVSREGHRFLLLSTQNPLSLLQVFAFVLIKLFEIRSSHSLIHSFRCPQQLGLDQGQGQSQGKTGGWG